ncbi:helix-turn-helix transcriptional regulator [Agromyces albus]|uniref:helix-turn-helix transcriptional regulator n=1 Tax=Agromyces albus TaxID=205332 RepID=UPI00277D32F0|nr:response regulator transcription factor [Agromyces albus]MDQ0576537.1 DNA-binding NarL/FixJ family response regulator [Agromyces albus]
MKRDGWRRRHDGDRENPWASAVAVASVTRSASLVAQRFHRIGSRFIGKGAAPEEIVRAVRSVHAGDALLSPAATRSLITRYVLPGTDAAHTMKPPSELEQLTEREREVFLLVARGRSNQEIAAELFISPATAKTHVNRVMSKLHAHDRAQLVIIAYESGLQQLGSA